MTVGPRRLNRDGASAISTDEGEVATVDLDITRVDAGLTYDCLRIGYIGVDHVKPPSSNRLRCAFRSLRGHVIGDIDLHSACEDGERSARPVDVVIMRPEGEGA